MIKQFCPQEFCLKCAGCCRFSQLNSQWSPGLLDEEIGILTKHLLPPALIDSQRKIRLKPSAKGDYFICPLLNEEENKCRIYFSRPFECQLYPFLINRRQEKIYFSVDLNCAYAKENFNQQSFKAYLAYLSSPLIAKACQEIIKNNPRLIQSYPEVIDLAEIK